MIEVTGLSVEHERGKDAFKEVDLEIDSGECVLLTGPCTSDKTTLALSLAGIIPRFRSVESLEGSVRIDGKDVQEFSKDELSRKVDAVLADPDTQILGLTVEEDIAFGCENMGISREEIHDRVDFALELMDLEEYWNRDPRNLSGGEKQRVTIASAIAKDPDILVMIEPSFHLDPQGKKVVIDVINRLKRDGKTVILVETKLDRSSLAADRALVLESGGIVFDGEVETLLQNRKILERIGVCPPERGEIHARVP